MGFPFFLYFILFYFTDPVRSHSPYPTHQRSHSAHRSRSPHPNQTSLRSHSPFRSHSGYRSSDLIPHSAPINHHHHQMRQSSAFLILKDFTYLISLLCLAPLWPHDSLTPTTAITLEDHYNPDAYDQDLYGPYYRAEDGQFSSISSPPSFPRSHL